MIKLPHNHGQDVQGLLSKMPSADQFQTVSDVFRQLSDPTRLRLFWILCHCEECVINLSAIMEMSSPAISHHLRQLKVNGLVISCRKGKEVYYKAAQKVQTDALHEMIERMISISCPDQEIPDLSTSTISGQTEIIAQVHAQLTGHLNRRYTIDQLSKQFLINTSALKETFKQVYGKPIASYMKEYRMQKAAEMLRDTTASISTIAATVGYENQSKFSKAFQDVHQILPTAYRKQQKNKADQETCLPEEKLENKEVNTCFTKK